MKPAVPVKIIGNFTSNDVGASIVKEIEADSPSLILVFGAVKVPFGASSLNMLTVTLAVVVTPLIIVPNVNTIVSAASTAVSFTGEIVTLAEVAPAGITICVPLTLYSVEPAEPDNVKGIVTSKPVTGLTVAVNTTPEVAFSNTVADDKAKVTVGKVSSFTIDNVKG